MKSLDALRGQKFVLTKDYDRPRHVLWHGLGRKEFIRKALES